MFLLTVFGLMGKILLAQTQDLQHVFSRLKFGNLWPCYYNRWNSHSCFRLINWSLKRLSLTLSGSSLRFIVSSLRSFWLLGFWLCWRLLLCLRFVLIKFVFFINLLINICVRIFQPILKMTFLISLLVMFLTPSSVIEASTWLTRKMESTHPCLMLMDSCRFGDPFPINGIIYYKLSKVIL